MCVVSIKDEQLRYGSAGAVGSKLVLGSEVKSAQDRQAYDEEPDHQHILVQLLLQVAPLLPELFLIHHYLGIGPYVDSHPDHSFSVFDQRASEQQVLKV